MIEPTNDEVLVDVDYVKRRFNVAKSWVYAAAESGRLAHVKIGRYLRFEVSAVEAYIEAQRKGGEAGNGDGGR